MFGSVAQTRSVIGGGRLCSGLYGPVKDIVVLEALTDEEVSEELSEVRIIGFVVESERSAVVEVDCELIGETSAQDLSRSGHFCKDS